MSTTRASKPAEQHPGAVRPASSERHRLHEARGAAAGVIAGAALGSIAGPAGVAAGAVIGGVVGAVVARVSDEEAARFPLHEGESTRSSP